ncbi:hypothetical protein Scep_027814 [Stephania cephalantha]|uniref:Uncharacterized protein n=1 Tax=Stephania cephalantha TaxID=152367 RepID=A0AAP0EC04_9MAGN
MNTVAPWHRQGNTFGRGKNGLTSTIRRGVFSPRGGMGMKARETLKHTLGGHAKARPKDHGASHPEPSSKNGLTSTIRRGVFSPWGGMGMKARETLEHALGGHAKARPKDHGASHPKRVGL